jgi:hypothetical protein
MALTRHGERYADRFVLDQERGEKVRGFCWSLTTPMA